jgi:hypothetical protein
MPPSPGDQQPKLRGKTAMDFKPLSDDELHQIRQRCENATPGPWVWVNAEVNGLSEVNPGKLVQWDPSRLTEVDGIPVFLGQDEVLAAEECDGYTGSFFINLADAAFIAHAREDIPKLLAEVDRLRGLPARSNP